MKSWKISRPLSWLKGLLLFFPLLRRLLKAIYWAFTLRLPKKLLERKIARLIEQSGLFDPVFYLMQYPDVAKAGLSPLTHYVSHGAVEGRDPHPLFDSSFYVEHNADVAATGANPFAHYLTDGAWEGRDPHPLFDTSFYLAQNPDVGQAGMNPLAHYMRYGASEGRDPHPLFDSSFYLERYPDVAEAGINPLAHYLMHGAEEGRDPHLLFTTSFYVEKNSDAGARGENPLVHFMRKYGLQEKGHALSFAHAPFAIGDDQMDPSEVKRRIDAFACKPLISVLIPTYNTDARFLRQAIDSVIRQSYSHWELCICDDGSTKQETLSTLRHYAGSDSRIAITYHHENRGIAAATNSALNMAHGDYIALLDHDDELAPHALFEVVQALHDNPGADVLYTDQDKIDSDGFTSDPFYKPDWSPELFRGVMYVGHLLVVRRTLACESGGFDSRFDKVQDFEFMLRLSEKTSRIVHVPKILYHWRTIPSSVASGGNAKSGIEELQALAVNEHLKRCSVPAAAYSNPHFAHRVLLKPHARTSWPPVSIIMQTKDPSRAAETALTSLLARTTYKNVEVILVACDTMQPETQMNRGDYPITFVGYDGSSPFTFAHAANLGAAHATGEYLILLNEDLDVMTQDWIETLLFHLELPAVGCVGPLILRPDGTVQHAGMVLGIGDTIGPVMRCRKPQAEVNPGSISCTREVSAVAGDCMMVSRHLFHESGCLRDYFAADYYPAVDLALRLLVSGKRNLWTPRAVLRQRHNAGSVQNEDPLDRALFLDIWGDMIQRGDPYYYPRVSLARRCSGVDIRTL